MTKNEKNKGALFEDDDFGTNTGAIQVYAKQNTMNVYKFFIDEEIGAPSTFRNFFACLDSATENDVIEIHLNTVGGSLLTALQLRNMIACTNAHVIAVCHGSVISAGTLIALSCPEIVVMPNTTWMVHAAAYGAGGKQGSTKEFVDFWDEQLWKVTKDVYSGFLTEDEIEDIILNDRDMWMDAEEISERLQMKVEYDKQKFLEKQAELLEKDNSAVEKPKKKVAKKKTM